MLLSSPPTGLARSDRGERRSVRRAPASAACLASARSLASWSSQTPQASGLTCPSLLAWPGWTRADDRVIEKNSLSHGVSSRDRSNGALRAVPRPEIPHVGGLLSRVPLRRPRARGDAGNDRAHQTRFCSVRPRRKLWNAHVAIGAAHGSEWSSPSFRAIA